MTARDTPLDGSATTTNQLISPGFRLHPGVLVASVAEVRAAVDAAVAFLHEGQQAVRVANDKLDAAHRSLAVADDGAGHHPLRAAQAALEAASGHLEECVAATVAATEHAQTYAATW